MGHYISEILQHLICSCIFRGWSWDNLFNCLFLSPLSYPQKQNHSRYDLKQLDKSIIVHWAHIWGVMFIRYAKAIVPYLQPGSTCVKDSSYLLWHTQLLMWRNIEFLNLSYVAPFHLAQLYTDSVSTAIYVMKCWSVMHKWTKKMMDG